jgi:hypothetical protein
MPDRFGQLLLLARGGSAVNLDLYEEAAILGRGFFLGCDDDVSFLREVELTIDRGSFESLEEETSLGDLPLPLSEHVIEHPESPPLRISASRPDPDRKLLTGTVWVYDDELTFRAEEWGSPEIIMIVVVVTWALVCGGSALRDALKTCEERAMEVCGRGGVKSVKSTRSWKKLGCAASCEIECLDGNVTRTSAADAGAPEPSPA